jgi:hypothetical protein
MPFQPGDMNKVLEQRGSNRSDFGAPPASVSGSPVAAKMSATRWKRQQPSTDTVTPSPFEQYRAEQPAQLADWGRRFLTTSAATEFTAPPMEPPTTEVA